MAQPIDPIAQVLVDLRHSLSDSLSLLSVTIDIRRNSEKLLVLLQSILLDFGEDIVRALPVLPTEAGE
jgi:hypothetical protein